MPELLKRITINPKQCGGRPCIRGMRIRVSDVLDLLVAGLSPEEILEEMPDLERDDLKFWEVAFCNASQNFFCITQSLNRLYNPLSCAFDFLNGFYAQKYCQNAIE